MIAKLTRGQFIKLALSKKGTPYVLGANGPDKMDCSGFVYWMYRQAGMKLGDHTASMFYQRSTPVKKGHYATGDMLFEANNPKRFANIGHMAMLLYPLKNGDWVVAEERGRATGLVATLASQWEKKSRFAGVRRMPGFSLLPDTPTGTFKVASAAMERPATGGTKDFSGTGKALASTFPDASIIFATETSRDMRIAYNAALGKWFKRRVSPDLIDTTVFYDTRKFTNVNGERKAIAFDATGQHGATAVPLQDSAGNQFVAVATHVRPGFKFSKTKGVTLAEKKREVEQAIALAGNGPAIIGGDFGMTADLIMRAHGFKRATPDNANNARIFAVYTRGFNNGSGRAVDPGTHSDHPWTEAAVSWGSASS